MKAALIGDVHANLPALEAVLAHAHKHGAEQVWNIGDFVGYGAFPEEVVQRLQADGAISIQGNYDRKVLKVKKKRDQWKKSKPPEKWLAFAWAYDHLSKPSRDYLKDLPEQRYFIVEGTRVLLVHGSPASQDEHLIPDTPDERFRELAGMTQADLIVFGHSHIPFMKQVEATWFVNTGSVGRPDDGDPRAAYAIADLHAGVHEIHHYRVPYDIEREVQALRGEGLPEDFARMTEEGRSLDVVQGDRAKQKQKEPAE